MTEPVIRGGDEVVVDLAATQLFSLLDGASLADLASRFQARRIRPGQVVTSAGDTDATLWVVAEGMVSIDERGPDGTVQQLAFGGYGTVIGTAGVFSRARRRTTVIAVEPTILLHTDREALWCVFEDRPEILDRLVLADGVRRRLVVPDPGAGSRTEIAIYRRHWFALLKGMVAPTLLLIATMGVAAGLALFTPLLSAAVPLAVLILAAMAVLVPAAAYAWAFFDYYNDFLKITATTVIRIERKPLIDHRRSEAPLVRIQDVQVVTPNLTARLLGYGTITVQTAASHGSFRFEMVPLPEHVREMIFAQVERAREEERRERQSHIEAEVRRAIGYGQGAGDAEEGIPPPVGAAPGAPSRGPLGLLTALAWPVLDYCWPKMRVQHGATVTWRKHWWFLVRNAMVPIVVFVTINTVVLFGWVTGRTVPGGVLGWVLLVTWLVLAARLWWGYANWRNDLYELTDDFLIDIERLPLGLFGERRQASLAQVQDLRYVVPGPWATFLNYGSVLIETAAEHGDFTFDYVFDPTSVHEEIIARIEVFRARQRAAEEERRAREWGRWLGAYHSIVSEGRTDVSGAPGPPPGAPAGPPPDFGPPLDPPPDFGPPPGAPAGPPPDFGPPLDSPPDFGPSPGSPRGTPLDSPQPGGTP